LIVSMPPRHGKSELISSMFPSWFLGRNPTQEIMLASYNLELASSFGRKTRNMVSSEEYNAVFGEIMAPDSQSVNKWHTKQGGSFFATGVGAAATGRGAHCIAEGELVATQEGQKPIEVIGVGDFVLSFNHKTGLQEWKKVTATRCINNRNVVSLAGKFLCTPEHLVYDGTTYIEAEKCRRVYAFLPHSVRELRKRIRKTFFCVEEKKTNKVLFGGLLQGGRIIKMVSPLSRLWRKIKQGCKEDAHVLPFQVHDTKEAKTDAYLRRVHLYFSGKALENTVLLHEMQEQKARKDNERKEKSEVERWSWVDAIQRGLQICYCTLDKKIRRAKVRCLLILGKACSSFELRQVRRQTRKFDSSLSYLSHYNPQIEDIRSDEITEAGIRTVYDLQVEDNENFFVNGVLVHNCLIIDDPLKNREEAESKTYRDRAWDWYTSTAYTRLAPGGCIVVVATRWHEDDPSGKLLEQMQKGGEKWEEFTFPAIADFDEEFRKQGEALWPERYPLKELENIKRTIGLYDFSALYQQQPVSAESQEFRKSMFKYRKWEEMDGKETCRFLTVDPAVSKRDEADFTGIVMNFVDNDNNWNLKSMQLKLSPFELISKLFDLHEQYRFDKIGIEKGVYQMTFKPFLDAEMKRRNVFLPIVDLDHGNRAKELRIRGLLPRYEAGSIYHIEGECDALENEELRFPKGRHEDVLDALAFQLQIATAPYGRKWRDTSDDEFNRRMRKKKMRKMKKSDKLMTMA